MLLIFFFLITRHSFMMYSLVIFHFSGSMLKNGFIVGCQSFATQAHSRHCSLEWSDCWFGRRALGQSPRSLEGSILRPPLGGARRLHQPVIG